MKNLQAMCINLERAYNEIQRDRHKLLDWKVFKVMYGMTAFRSSFGKTSECSVVLGKVVRISPKLRTCPFNFVCEECTYS